MNLQVDSWSADYYARFVEYLKTFADEKYRSFHSALVPTEQVDTFLGVRMPKLRELGKEISKGNPRDYLNMQISGYYEEKMLRGIVTGLIKPKNFDDLVKITSLAHGTNAWKDNAERLMNN